MPPTALANSPAPLLLPVAVLSCRIASPPTRLMPSPSPATPPAPVPVPVRVELTSVALLPPETLSPRPKPVIVLFCTSALEPGDEPARSLVSDRPMLALEVKVESRMVAWLADSTKARALPPLTVAASRVTCEPWLAVICRVCPPGWTVKVALFSSHDSAGVPGPTLALPPGGRVAAEATPPRVQSNRSNDRN